MMKQRALTPQMRHILKHLNLARELHADWKRIVSDPNLSLQEKLAVKRRWIEKVERVDFDAIDHFLDRVVELEGGRASVMRH